MAIAGDEATDAFRRSVRPVFGVSRRDAAEQIGSSVLIEIDGRKLIITAAHVIDANASTSLYVAGSGTLEPLETEFHATKAPYGDRARDHYDFAFAELSPATVVALGEVRFLDEAETVPAGSNVKNRMFTAIGFPNSKNKHVNPTAKKVRGQLYQYSSVHRFDEALARKLGIAGDDHLFIDHRKHAADETGRKVSPIGPRGLSGGAMIEATEASLAIFRGTQQSSPRLAGIIIERHANTLLATRIDTIIAAIRRSWLVDA